MLCISLLSQHQAHLDIHKCGLGKKALSLYYEWMLKEHAVPQEKFFQLAIYTI